MCVCMYQTIVFHRNLYIIFSYGIQTRYYILLQFLPNALRRNLVKELKHCRPLNGKHTSSNSTVTILLPFFKTVTIDPSWLRILLLPMVVVVVVNCEVVG